MTAIRADLCRSARPARRGPARVVDPSPCCDMNVDQYLVNPAHVVRRMPRQLQRLIGFEKAGNALGFVEWDDDGGSELDPLAVVDTRWDNVSPSAKL